MAIHEAGDASFVVADGDAVAGGQETAIVDYGSGGVAGLVAFGSGVAGLLLGKHDFVRRAADGSDFESVNVIAINDRSQPGVEAAFGAVTGHGIAIHVRARVAAGGAAVG